MSVSSSGPIVAIVIAIVFVAAPHGVPPAGQRSFPRRPPQIETAIHTSAMR
jgi:hypothetical protein